MTSLRLVDFFGLILRLLRLLIDLILGIRFALLLLCRFIFDNLSVVKIHKGLKYRSRAFLFLFVLFWDCSVNKRLISAFIFCQNWRRCRNIDTLLLFFDKLMSCGGLRHLDDGGFGTPDIVLNSRRLLSIREGLDAASW